MKLSEFKAQYLPWSKEYKLREEQEEEARKQAFFAQYNKEIEKARSRQTAKNYAAPPSSGQPVQSSSSSSTFGDALLGSLVGNVIGNALSSHSSSDSSSSSSYSSSSDSDSSSSWSDSSSSWSDSGSSSWD